jgi:hypothetical protein
MPLGAPTCAHDRERKRMLPEWSAADALLCVRSRALSVAQGELPATLRDATRRFSARALALQWKSAELNLRRYWEALRGWHVARVRAARLMPDNNLPARQ